MHPTYLNISNLVFVERYIRKYGDVEFIRGLSKRLDLHVEARDAFNRQTYEQLSKLIDLVEAYIKEQAEKLAELVELLAARMPEVEELGLKEIRERLLSVVRESDIVIERLRARLEEIKEGKITHMTLDEAFDLVKELNEIWATAGKVVRFYMKLHTDLSPLFIITV